MNGRMGPKWMIEHVYRSPGMSFLIFISKEMVQDDFSLLSSKFEPNFSQRINLSHLGPSSFMANFRLIVLF